MPDEIEKNNSKVSEKVEIDKDTLKEILTKLEKVDKLQENLDEKEATITKLLAVADKGRLLNYEAQQGEGSLIRVVNLSTWEGDIVLGWKTIKNEVGFKDGVLREEQIVRLFLYNKDEPTKEKHVDVDLLNFNRFSEKMSAEITKDSTDSKGKRTLMVKLKDGMELEYDIAFVN